MPTVIGSARVTPCAADGPALLTTMVKVTRPPGVTGSGESTVIVMSASGFTVVLADAELFEHIGSPALLETETGSRSYREPSPSPR